MLDMLDYSTTADQTVRTEKISSLNSGPAFLVVQDAATAYKE